MGDVFVCDLVAVPAAGDVGAEIPVETFAEQTAGDEADALEELEAGLIEEIVFMVNIGTWKAEDVVETDAFLGIESIAGAAILHTKSDAVGLGEGAHDAEADAGGRRPELDILFLRGEAEHITELDIKVATPFGTVAER